MRTPSWPPFSSIYDYIALAVIAVVGVLVERLSGMVTAVAIGLAMILAYQIAWLVILLRAISSILGGKE